MKRNAKHKPLSPGAILAFGLLGSSLLPAQEKPLSSQAWMNSSLTPEARTALLLPQMTLDEKIAVVHGLDDVDHGTAVAPAGHAKIASGAVGYVPDIPRLGIPALQIADAAVGVTKGAWSARYSTPLPSALCEASAWDNDLSFEKGALLGRELKDAGFNMSLAGGTNIARDPRNGRNFEYLGEDPVLAGTLVGQAGRGVQSQGVIGDIKHFAVNDQETDRTTLNVVMDRRTLRETDMLAFEIGIKSSGVDSVMCAYNKYNGDYACESPELLRDVLKRDLGFKGFVISDWGATHTAVKAANAGLDMQMPGNKWFGEPLKQAVLHGEVSQARLDDMVSRILRAEFAAGLFDRKPTTQVSDIEAGMATAQRIAEEGAVLLKNDHAQLPLTAKARTILLVGGHADVGVLTGGGSSRVDGPGGNAIPATGDRAITYLRSSPLKELQARMPDTTIRFDSGDDPAKAAELAKTVDVAIVFATQYSREDRDLVDLSLPDRQDALIAAVATANPHTVVVLETGDPVTMPWLGKVPAVLEAWYPGIHGAQAIANLLTGAVSPSGKLAISFPAAEADLPHAKLFDTPKGAPEVHYTEGLKVGYKWYDAEGKHPLFAFGHGLSYSSFAYSGLKTAMSDKLHVSFTLTNTGNVAATEIAEVYATLPDGTGEPPRRLIGWRRVKLAPKQSQEVEIMVDPMLLSVFDAAKNGWSLTPGRYVIHAGGSSQSLPLEAELKVK
ncbi:beta-glucosidase [Granulicella rosea]|uniref:Beta-glucosidase n=1 Tax=Granulicella rosea TaxID=474952 RepID=A0A239LW92_9BACT|nr:beta-glucosidase [Granulicella rosea]SNT34796.1 beta-glucosidase [Granulicella rosea]